MTSVELVAVYVADRSRENRDRVLASYHYLCARGARKFARPGTDRADLMQVAAIGLIKAVTKYDDAFKTPFEAYAWMIVLGELMHYVRDHEGPIRLPRHVKALERQYLLAFDTLSVSLGRMPTTHEVASAMSVTPDTIEELRAARRSGNVMSIEAQTGSPLGELPALPATVSTDDKLSLMAALKSLGERERTIVLGLFASGLSQAELGMRLGVTQSQVSKLMKKALQKLQLAVA
jgi:RNA polymerase sigma-B factor